LKGIRWIRSQIDESENQAGCAAFWNYFSETWIKFFPPEVWNIARHLGSNSTESIDRVALTCRANNALERFNQMLGQLFPDKPTVPEFVEQIGAQAQLFLGDIKSINSRAKAKVIHTHLPRSIPLEYSRYAIQHAGEVEIVKPQFITPEQYNRSTSNDRASTLNLKADDESASVQSLVVASMKARGPLAVSWESEGCNEEETSYLGKRSDSNKRAKGHLARSPKVAKKK
jgi:hypothetical protein